MLNALQPGSYVQPHRHAQPPRAETIVLLRGSIGHVLFDDGGEIEQHSVLSPASGNLGIDTRPGVFHTFFALEEDTIVFEVKAGPYDQTRAKEVATWAPAEAAAGAAEYLRRLEKVVRD
jgi:cupin fold WbuC family metalloprotein